MDKEKMVNWAVSMIRKGYHRDKILKAIKNYGFEPYEIYEIARCRVRIKDKFSRKNLYFDTYGLRYSTPEIIGRYRAKRIRGYRIADISCGTGMQAIFFAETNKEVLCVDLDSRRVEYARLNAKAYGLEPKMKFLSGNCFSDEVYKMAKNYDIIYSDPARSEGEEERTLENLRPSPVKIMEKYGDRNYVFDLPPQISQRKIPDNWEKEYISLHGKIRRLTVYLGELYTHDRKAVALPSGETLFSDSHSKFTIKTEFSDYVYIVDESIYYAGMLGELERKYPIWYLQTGKRRTLAASTNLINSGFLRPFRVIYFSESIDEILDFLKKENYGKITLRFSVEPSKYWEIRKDIESMLKGKERASLFKIGSNYVVGVECNIT